MRNNDTPVSRRLGVYLWFLGGGWTGRAAGAAVAAVSHMDGAAPVCGPVSQHCILCVAAAASLFASVGVIASGMLLMRTPSSPQQAVQVIAPRH